jgi:8-oxo-dGTP pyrophosphatase MutT (NUDIX family)
MSISSNSQSLSQTISLIADELRALAQNNLQYTEDPYQIQRNQRVRELAAQLQSLADTRPPEDIQRIFSQDLGYLTPMSVAEAAVVDAQGSVLLIQRADDGDWALPGGACDTGETPAEAAAREVWEESGYQVEITRLLGVFDSRLVGTQSSRHLYHLLFAAVPVAGEARISNETCDVRWFGWDEIPWEMLSPGHHRRLQFVMQWWLNPQTRAYFDWRSWQPPNK